MSSVFINPKVNISALNRFLSHFKAQEYELHTLQIFDHDTPMVRIGIDPYAPSDKREVFSLSKSFCSTAIGILVTNGLLSVEDRIIDIFPDQCPEIISENLAAMRVRHVLSMNTGHSQCVMPNMVFTDNPVKAFLAQEVPFAPGTHFAYNTGATCLLSCMVTKLTGLNLVDFLTKHLFLPLGIEEISWYTTHSDENTGGVGCCVSSDDIIKLGQLYLYGGVYNGKRILSEEWVKLATSPISKGIPNGTIDWCSGYGFQFWMNSREGFRGDGYAGQLCFVLPERGIIAATQAFLGNMQLEVDLLMELICDLYGESDTETVILPDYPAFSSTEKTVSFDNTVWKFDKNPGGYTIIRLKYHAEDDAMHLILSNGREQYVIKSGNGKWIENTIYAAAFKPKLTDLQTGDTPERCRFTTSYKIEKDKIVMCLRFLDGPHSGTLSLSVQDGVLHFDIDPEQQLHDGAAHLTAHLL